MSEVSILVLGGSGVGKTCFMLAMYDDMRVGYGGFTFSATDLDLDRTLVDRFRRLLDLEGEARWPAGTGDIERYEFNLNYALRRFMIFGWHDYRGQILNDAGKPLEEIRDLAQSADVVMICAPGDLLHLAAFERSAKARSQLLVAETQQLLEFDEGEKPSIVILVTKFDLFAARCKENNSSIDEAAATEKLVEAVRRQYQALFADNGQWRVLICPVSLGPELAAEPDHGAIEPQNMHLPVMYAYHEYAKVLASQWASRVAAKEAEADELKSRWFAKNRTRAAFTDLEQLRNHHGVVQERLRIVRDQLTIPLFFYNGRPSALD